MASVLITSLIVATKYLTRDDLREKGLISAYSSKGCAPSWWGRGKCSRNTGGWLHYI